jgi:hypothetical protein
LFSVSRDLLAASGVCIRWYCELYVCSGNSKLLVLAKMKVFGTGS